MDGVSYTAASQAQTQAQTSLIAMRETINAQRQIAEMLSKQVEQTQASQPAAAANPSHLGGSVDTYA